VLASILLTVWKALVQLHADQLANAGALYSKQHAGFEELSLDDILEHYTFNYLKLDGIT
jgi:hypothetical protein